MAPGTTFTVVYDSDCGLCARAKDWMRQQVPLVELHFVAAGSPEARRRFPEVAASELAVVAGTGEMWFADRAWIVCLWALRDYRDLACRLTSPLLSVLAREAFAIVSKYRLALSCISGLRSEREIEQRLRKAVAPRCRNGPANGQD